MKRTFEYQDGKSNKFWSIEVNGTEVTVNYGKTGTSGQTQTKQFGSDAESEKHAEKLIAEKTKKGYVEQGADTAVSATESTNTTGTATAPAQASKSTVVKSSAKPTPVAAPLNEGEKINPKRRTFEYHDYKAEKFWNVEQDDVLLHILYGKIGGKGRTDTKVFDTDEKAGKEMLKLIRKKTGEGYMETTPGAAPLPDISELTVNHKLPVKIDHIYIGEYSYNFSPETMMKNLKDEIERGRLDACDEETLQETVDNYWKNLHATHEIIRLAQEQAERNNEIFNPQPKKVKIKEPINPPKNGKTTKKHFKQMYEAIRDDETEDVKTLVGYGVTGNDEHNNNPLFETAMMYGNLEHIKLLIPTLTHYYAGEGDFYVMHKRSFTSSLFAKEKDEILAILDAGYDLKKDPAAFSHLAYLKDRELLDRVLAEIPLSMDVNGDAMLSAVHYGNVELIDYLLEKGAKLDGYDSETGEYVMHYAIDRLYEKPEVIIKLVKAGAPMNVQSHGHQDWYDANAPRTGGGETPAMQAMTFKARHNNVVDLDAETKAFLMQFNDVEISAEQAFKAAKNAQFAIVKSFVDKNGADVRDKNGASLLHYVMMQSTNIEIIGFIDYLTEKGADANALDNKGRNPLFYVDVNTNYHGGANYLQHLIEKGAYVDCVDDEGMTPIMFHSRFRPFFDGEPDEDTQKVSDRNGRTPALKYLTACGADLNRHYADGKTIFHYLLTLPTFFQDDEIIEAMMKAGGNVNTVDNKGQGPFHCAATKKYNTALDDRIAIYVKKGKADLNIQDNDGNTALHRLVLDEDKYAINDLLRHGADPTIKNNEGKSAEDLMAEFGILDSHKRYLEEFHRTPPETRNIKHVWNPVEITDEIGETWIKDMKIYSSMMLPGHSTADHVDLVGKNRILCRDLHGRYTCIDSQTGQVKWTENNYEGHRHPLYIPEDDIVYSGYGNKTFVAVDPETGDQLWTVPVGFSYDSFSSPFLVYNDIILFHSKSSVHAINKKTKKREWKIKLSGEMHDYHNAIWQHYLIVQSSTKRSTTFHLININTGMAERSIEVDGGFRNWRGGYVLNDKLWYVTDDYSVRCIDLESGETEPVLLEGQPLFVRGFYMYNEKFYFSLDTSEHEGIENGLYECDKDKNIKMLTNDLSGFSSKAYQAGACIYDTGSDTLYGLSFETLESNQFELPHYSGTDIIECDPRVNNGTLFLSQLGGNENNDNQVLYAIK